MDFLIPFIFLDPGKAVGINIYFCLQLSHDLSKFPYKHIIIEYKNRLYIDLLCDNKIHNKIYHTMRDTENIGGLIEGIIVSSVHLKLPFCASR